MDRRKFLSAISSVAVVGVAGCSAEAPSTQAQQTTEEVDRNDPESVFRAYLLAVKHEDMGRVRSLRSSDVDEQNIATLSVEYSERDMEIEYLSVDDESETEATISYVLSLQDGDSGFAVPGEALLLKEDDEWFVEEVR